MRARLVNCCTISTVVDNAQAKMPGITPVRKLNVLRACTILEVLAVRSKGESVTQPWLIRKAIGCFEIYSKPDGLIAL